MDLSKLGKGDRIFIGGSIVFLLSSFFAWFTLDAGIIKVSANGWDVGFLWCTLWLVAFVGLSVVLALPAFGKPRPPVPGIAFLAVGALATLFVLLKVLIGEDAGGINVDRSFGLFLALISAAVVTFGGFLKFTESGGTVDELKDLDKIKRRFREKG